MGRRRMGRCAGTVAVPSGETFPCGSPAMVGGRFCSFHARAQKNGEPSEPAETVPATVVAVAPPPPVRAVPPTIRKRPADAEAVPPPARSRS